MNPDSDETYRDGYDGCRVQQHAKPDRDVKVRQFLTIFGYSLAFVGDANRVIGEANQEADNLETDDGSEPAEAHGHSYVDAQNARNSPRIFQESCRILRFVGHHDRSRRMMEHIR
jgi:hypothetical protein